MPTLIQLLATLATQYPLFRAEIERWRKHEKVSDQEWNEHLTKLAKNSAEYFPTGVITPPTPGFTYDAWLQSDPGDSKLGDGDYVYAQPKGAPDRWFVHEGGPLNFGMPGFPSNDELIRVVSK